MKKAVIIKILLTIILLAVLVYKIDFQSILLVLESMNIYLLICALLLVPVMYLLRALRWQAILHSTGITLPFYRTFKILMIGNFYGLITPGKIGELGRAFHISEKKAVTVPTVALEKLIDIAVLVFLSTLTLIFLLNDSFFLKVLLLVVIIGTVGGLVALVNVKFLRFSGKYLGIGGEDIDIFVATLRKLLKNYPLLLTSIGIAFAYYLVNYLVALFLVVSGDMLLISVTAMPVIILMGNIPITISGLGIRESVGSLTFVLLGDTAANGFVFSLLLFLFITVIPGIFGYIFTLFEK